MVNDVNYQDGAIATMSAGCPGRDVPMEPCGGPLPAGFQPEALPPSAEVFIHLMAIGEELRQHVAVVAARFDFTPQQALLVERLIVPRTMGQIAEALGCDKSNVTGMISRLESRGLVARTADGQDRRIKWLTLTDAGRAVREELREQIEQGQVLIAGFDDGERDAFLGFLRRVGASLVVSHSSRGCVAATGLAEPGHGASPSGRDDLCRAANRFERDSAAT